MSQNKIHFLGLAYIDLYYKYIWGDKMESIKSYFQIVFLIFILLSSIFIGFKNLVLIIEIKKGKQKNFNFRCTTKQNIIFPVRKSEYFESNKENHNSNIQNRKQEKNERYEIIKYDNGDAYKGELVNGKRNGFGVCIFKNKDRYEGLWKDDLMHSIGKYIYKDGATYSGDFRLGIF